MTSDNSLYFMSDSDSNVRGIAFINSDNTVNLAQNAGTGDTYIRGKLGVGTTSPAVTLDIYGTDAIRIPVGTSVQRPTGSMGFMRFNTTTHQFEGYGDNGVWQGLGGVIDADQDTYITADTNNSDEDTLRLFTAGSERMTILPDGSLGIGTTSPVSKFAVSGDTYLDGALTATGAATFSSLTNGLVKSTAGVLSNATAGTDYAPATSGSSLLYGNGAGGFSNATVSTATGISFSGGALALTTVPVANGGTGATTAAGARSNLSAAASGANTDITSLSGLTSSVTQTSPIILTNTSPGSVGTFDWIYDAMTPNIVSGSGALFLFGKAHSTNNSSHFDFVYSGNGSTNNRFSIGFYNNDNILNVLANGHVGVGTTSPYAKLSVDGDLALTGGIYDSTATRGTAGQILLTTGTGVQWTSTSSLGLASAATTAALTSSLTNNYAPKWNSSTNTFNDSLIYDSGTQIGIGTASNLNGALTAAGTFGVQAEGDIFRQYDSGDAAWYPVIARYNTANGSFPGSTYIFGAGANANVGIEKPGGDPVTSFHVRALASTFSGTVSAANITDTGLTADTLTYANGSKQLTSASVSGPLAFSSGVLSIANAAADGSTKGAAAFMAADFNATTGVISIDYANGQQANASQNGFLSSADWSTFNGKLGSSTISSLSNNFLAKWNDTTKTFNDSLIYDDGTNAGIGTASPAYKLDVNGDVNVAAGDAYRYNGQAVITASTTLGNYFFGPSAGNLTMTGGSNYALGYNAFISNTTGFLNTALGNSALQANTTGFYNAATGYGALGENTTGADNAAFGAMALSKNTTGDQNAAFGAYAGRYIADGTSANASSSNSVYAGYGSKALANGDTNEIVLGYNAIGNGSNSATLGNDSITKTILKGSVGVGTTSPYAKLSVDGDFALTGGFYDNNATRGAAGQVLLTTGSGVQWTSTSTLGLASATTTAALTASLTNNYAPKWSTSSNAFIDSLIYDGGTQVGIGTNSPHGKLDVKGGDLNVSNANGISLLKLTTGTNYSSIYSTYYSGPDLPLYLGTEANQRAVTIQATTGNVGIGTTSPIAKFSVNTGADKGILLGRNATYDEYNTIALNGSLSSPIGLTGGADGDTTLYVQSGIGGFEFDSASGVPLFVSGATDGGVTIGDGFASATDDGPANGLAVEGNVGIGTTTPGTKLVVSGTGTLDQIIDTGLTADTLAYANGSKQLTSASVSGPLAFASGVLSIANAAADGSTKGAASFAAGDFNATSCNITLDYTNGQQASGLQNGFLSSTDWSTFNGKLGSSTISSLSNNFLAKWNSSTNTFNDSLIYDDGTNVGIGTTTPDSLLTLSGSTGPQLLIDSPSTANVTGSYFAYGGVRNAGVQLIGSTFATADRQSDLELFADSGDITFAPGNVGTKVTFKSDGNVGIGTTTPWGKLTVNASAGQPSFVVGSTTTQFIVDQNGKLGVGTSTPTVGLELANGTGDAGGINIWNQTGANYQLGRLGYANGSVNVLTLSTRTNVGGTNQDIRIAPGSASTYFNASGQVGIGYDSTLDTTTGSSLAVAGRIGIGTASPQSRLDIAAAGRDTGNTAYGLRITNTATGSQATNLGFVTGGGTNWAIGTDYKANGTGGFYIGTSTNGFTPGTAFGSSATVPFEINTEGTIGLLNFPSAPATTAKRLYEQ
jgi:hypothetical protein